MSHKPPKHTPTPAEIAERAAAIKRSNLIDLKRLHTVPGSALLQAVNGPAISTRNKRRRGPKTGKVRFGNGKREKRSI
jgi:hypothetical protein